MRRRRCIRRDAERRRGDLKFALSLTHLRRHAIHDEPPSQRRESSAGFLVPSETTAFRDLAAKPSISTDIPGFERDDLAEAFAAFRRSAEAIVSNAALLRPARPAFLGLEEISRAALEDPGDPATFFKRWFQPFRLQRTGLLTGYYEVEVEARREAEPGFAIARAGAAGRPRHLERGAVDRGRRAAPLSPRGGARTGRSSPILRARKSRKVPGKAASPPLAYLADWVELFLIQVQGSARLKFPDGSSAALTYDGRNGHPDTSVGRLLIERGLVEPEAMSLSALKAALRSMGSAPGEAGRRLMHENHSYIFFRLDDLPERALGPIGGAGLALSPLALHRRRPLDLVLWAALLDRGGDPLAPFAARILRAPHDCAGHGLRNPWRSPRRSLLWLGRESRRARGRHSA